MYDPHPSFKEELQFKDKNKFWELFYQKITEAVDKNYNFAVLFTMEAESSLEGPSYSVIIEKKDYEKFLINCQLWNEQTENYEVCAQIKKTLQKLKKCKNQNSD
ncbi:hypothetical protein EBS02_01515 [bacterium]|jgi:hypothetical protein|nr:hypothetical protein [bacterium]